MCVHLLQTRRSQPCISLGRSFFSKFIKALKTPFDVDLHYFLLIIFLCGEYMLILWHYLCGPPGVRMYHSLTAVPGWGAVVFGGRTSPLHPIGSVLRVTYDLSSLPDPSAPDGPVLDWLSVEELACTGKAPLPRWRHTATLLRYKGQARTRVERVNMHRLDCCLMSNFSPKC